MGWIKIERIGPAEVPERSQGTIVHQEAVVPTGPEHQQMVIDQEYRLGQEPRPHERLLIGIMEIAPEAMDIVQAEAADTVPEGAAVPEVEVIALEEAVVLEVLEVTVVPVAAQEVLEAIEAPVHPEAPGLVEDHLPEAVVVVVDVNNHLAKKFHKL